jgi:iron complex outermembrane recepter protein
MSWNTVKFCSLGGVSCIAFGFATLPHAVHAQAQQAQVGTDAGLEEIVVTARKREENLQDVPVAVTFMNQETLRERNISEPYDLQFSTPGLQVRSGSNSNTPQYFIRGQGAQFNTAPGVVPYFAEAPLSISDNFAIYDMENVQVLKGPQGTLFGRSTTGGAILLTPHKPTDTWESYVDLKYGDYDTHEIEAALNIPVLPNKLELRLAGDSVRREGYTKNLVNGQDLDGRHRDSFRIGMSIKPFDGFENYTLFQLINTNESGSAAPLIEFNPLLPLFNTTPNGRGYGSIVAVCGGLNQGNAAANASCVSTRVDLLNQLVNNLAAEANRIQTGGNNAVRFSQSLDPRQNISETEEIHDIATYDLGSRISWLGDTTLKNIFSTTRTLKNLRQVNFCDSAYLHCENTTGGQTIVNGAQVIDPSLAADKWLDHYTEEVQVAGRGKGFNWILGWFDQSDTTPPSSGVVFPTFRNVFSRSLTNVVYATNPMVYDYSLYTNYFGQATVDLGELAAPLKNLSFTGGYAVSHLNSTTVNATPVYTTTGTVMTGALNAPVVLDQGGQSYNFSLDYKINPDLLIYVTTRKGFKQGGNNAIVVNTLPGVVYAYDPEYDKDLEFGTKYTYRLGNAVGRSNLAVYYDWYSDIQRQQVLANPNPPFNPQVQINNIGAAHIYGLEWENEARIDRLSLRLNYAYIAAKYTAFPGFDTNALGQKVPFIDSRYPGTPKTQITIGPHYEVMDDHKLGAITVGGDYYWQSSVELDDQPTSDPYNAGLQKAYGVLNLRMDWTNFAGYPIDLATYVTNATNSTFMTGIKSFITNLGVVTANYNEPRMFGLELRCRFR